MFADSLVVIGMAALSLGTIREAEGTVERSFLLRNAGWHAVCLSQGYTSCGCTTIQFAKDSCIAIGDTTAVILRFNPRGKSGEFFETGTLVYAVNGDPSARQSLTLSLEGTCLSSEESLAQQFPIRVYESLWLNANRFDLGIMSAGETKERGVVVLHRGEAGDNGQVSDRQELITVSFSADAQMPKGVQHISRTISVQHDGNTISIPIMLDVRVK
ncbi:MAG: DUF1573 domain-containing protein [Bacteroidaceae bacterium]|nr:DUF1573 domain-containing protein [Bacteroidaceae bacterium]MBQ9285958.1 DUF1573 domain-containing protein [Bacteroidaceae bacterium]